MASIHLTQSARNRLMQLRNENKLGAEFFLRICVKTCDCAGSAFHLDFDNKIQKGDVENGEYEILVVADKKSFSYLCGGILDYSEHRGEGKFHFIKTKEETCDCR